MINYLCDNGFLDQNIYIIEYTVYSHVKKLGDPMKTFIFFNIFEHEHYLEMDVI